jgi:hypothetical protein
MELDVAFSIFADINDKLEKSNKYLGKLASPEVQPVRKPVGGSAVAAAGVPTLIDTFASPSRGNVWQVIRVALFGSDGHTVLAAVVADVYGGYGPDASAPDMSSQFLSGVPVAGITLIGPDRVWMHHQETLYAIVYGAAAGQSLELVAMVDEYPIPAKEAMIV